MVDHSKSSERHLRAQQAKEFLISQIVEEAQKENFSLSEVERKMLYFTETEDALSDIYEVNDQFEREYDTSAYEKKITGLLRNAYRRSRKESPESENCWKQAIADLRKEDHYLLVMVDESLQPSAAMAWAIGIGISVVIFLLIILWIALDEKRLVPKWVFAQNESKVPCSSYQQCNEMGTNALQAGKTDTAIQLFELQAGYAEIADINQGHVDYGPGRTPSYTLGINAYNNLAVAYMHKGDYLRARLWCRLALHWDKGNKAALYNLSQIDEKLKQWRWPKFATGMYLRYAGRGQWESLCVRQDDSNKMSVSFFGMRMGPDPEGTPASYGDFKANLALSNHSATYAGEPEFPCTVRMDFSEDKVVLKQNGDCGFGYGVQASGTFERASTSAECPK